MAYEDYWTGTGYSQMPDSSIPEGYRPFDISKAFGHDPVAGWDYAPWAGGPTQDLDYGEIDPYAGGNYPSGREATASPWEAGAYGAGAGLGTGAAAYGAGMASGGVPGFAGLMSAGVLGPAGLIGAGLGAGLNAFGVFDKKKKRGSPERSDPSYQGYAFEPAEGFPKYYETAQGQTMNQHPADEAGQFQYQSPGQYGYDYNYTGGVAQPSGQLADLSQQNYVGQQEQEYGSFYNRDRGGIFDTFTV